MQIWKYVKDGKVEEKRDMLEMYEEKMKNYIKIFEQ